MARQTAWVLALVVACVPALGAAAREGLPQGRPDKPLGAAKGSKDQPQEAANRPGDRERWKWWLYDRAELGITDRQSAEINDVFETTIPRLREARQQLDRAEEELSRTIKEHKADVASVSMLLDRVESARTQHNKLRTLMLYRMHLLLSDEQRGKLQALRARQDRERRDREPSPDRRRP